MNWPRRNPDLSALAASGKVRTIHDGKNPPGGPRAFSQGEKALIRRVHGLMSVQQLLGILNERMVSDTSGAAPFTVEQLYAEISALETIPAGGHDWSSLRKLVAKARRDGVLDKITRQVIDDFAVVYSLSSGQVLRLHDVLLRAKEEA